jgi:hypothetical protein
LLNRPQARQVKISNENVSRENQPINPLFRKGIFVHLSCHGPRLMARSSGDSVVNDM